jgi:protein-tyrosine phosphatase
MIDCHTHLLPGLDDGAVSWEQALALARLARAKNTEAVVLTPHYLTGVYQATKKEIIAQVGVFRAKLREAQIPLEVYCGQEVYLAPDLARLLHEEVLLTINDGGRYLLTELPMAEIPAFAEDVLFQLMLQGVTPILAHPERNRQISQNPTWLYQVVSRGVLVQVNSGSLTGRFGNTIKKTALILVAHRLVHLIGSDAHDSGHRPPGLTGAVQCLRQITDDRMVDRLTLEFPRLILEGKALPEISPIPLKRRNFLRRWKFFS